jgi:flavin-dependent dehydrogenase
MLLARRGYRVLLVDRATFPSDIYKNHFVRQEGIAQLARWGLLEKVKASNCPPVRTQILDLGDFPLLLETPLSGGADAEYGPRRIVLDKILVDAAVEAGVELREGFSVLEVLTENDRAVGIRGKSQEGGVVTEYAKVIIGADGHHSIVASTMKAPAYNVRPVLTCGYYSYWSGVQCDKLEVYIRDRPAFLLAFPTNDGLTCLATELPLSQFAWFRTDIEGNFNRIFDLAPDIAERMHAGTREERFRGTADLPNFMRKPYGQGWALVGDAGYHKDPFTARGVSDAFRDAELLANAVDEALSGRRTFEKAMATYERKRNEEAMPGYDETCAMASFLPVPPQAFEWRRQIRAEQAGRAVLVAGA